MEWNKEEGLLPRRAWLAQQLRRSAGVVAGLAGAGTWQQAQAGAQKEEYLADSVRTALSSAIAYSAPPVPVFFDRKSEMEYRYWLTSMSQRLGNRMINDFTRQEFLQTVWYEATRAALEVSLVLGLIQVESNFRKFAISNVGARGLMQVMPFWVRQIGDGDAGKLFHMQTNLRFGCVILRHYLYRESGNMYMALGRYNGSRGQPRCTGFAGGWAEHGASFFAGKLWRLAAAGRTGPPHLRRRAAPNCRRGPSPSWREPHGPARAHLAHLHPQRSKQPRRTGVRDVSARPARDGSPAAH